MLELEARLDRLTAPTAPLEDIGRQIVERMPPPRPRERLWRLVNGASLTALLGLLLSGGIFLAQWSYQNSSDEREARAELARITTSLVEAPTRLGQRQAEFGQTSPDFALAASRSATSEVIVLVNQFMEIATEHPDLPTAIDYFTVSSSYSLVGDQDAALDQIDKAIGASSMNVSMRVNSNRQRGIVLFTMGRAEEGRAAFTDARAIIDASSWPATQKESYLVDTLVNWASYEAGAKQCPDALRLLGEAQTIATQARAPWQFAQGTPMGTFLANAEKVLVRADVCPLPTAAASS